MAEAQRKNLRIVLGLAALIAACVTLYQYDQERIGRSAQYQYGSRNSAITILARFADTKSALFGRRGPRQIILIAQRKKPGAMPSTQAAEKLIPAAAEGFVLISADEPPKVQVCKPPLFEKLWEIWAKETYQEQVQEPVAREREAVEKGAAGQPFARFVLARYKDRLGPTLKAFIEGHNR